MCTAASKVLSYVIPIRSGHFNEVAKMHWKHDVRGLLKYRGLGKIRELKQTIKDM